MRLERGLVSPLSTLFTLIVKLVLIVGLETIVRPELTAVLGLAFNFSVSKVTFFSDTDGALSSF